MKTYITCLPVGGQSKTTLAAHVLATHAPAPAIVSIETASPSGTEVELLSQDEGRGARVLRSRLFAGSANHTTIVDSGVTDATVIAEVLTDLARMRQLPADLTVILPCDGSRKSISGLGNYVPTLPTSVRRVLVHSLVRDSERGWAKLRETEAMRKLHEWCAAHSIEVCPVPMYYCALLDTESPYHDLLREAGSVAAVASLDLDALRERARAAKGDHDAEDRLGEALTGIDMAQTAAANLRAVYEYLSGETGSRE